MSLTDEEIQELCLDCGLGVVIGDHFKNLARAIERIATQRALEAAAEVIAKRATKTITNYQDGKDISNALGNYLEGRMDEADYCHQTIRAMAKEMGV